MRTEKRFTPKVLERFQREGRGTGTYTDYVPWHRVSRGDPSSKGRSHLIVWMDRQRELLSDHEWGGLNFAGLVPGLIDLAEQFPISQDVRPVHTGVEGTPAGACTSCTRPPRAYGGRRN